MPEDLSIADVIAKLRRAYRLRCEVFAKYEAPANTFHSIQLRKRLLRWAEGFWPYEAQDARN